MNCLVFLKLIALPNSLKTAYFIQIISLATSLCLTACGTPTAPSTDYAQRLVNVLDVDIGDARAETQTAKFPSVKQLEIVEAEQSISIREFLGLRQCKLHLAIAERNSQIGRVASSSQRLMNDLAILASGPDCVEKIDNTELRRKLIDYLAVKEQAIAQRLWHALLGSEEYRQLWQNQTHQPTYPKVLAVNDTVKNLEALRSFSENVLNRNYPQALDAAEQLEQILGQLRYGDAGQLLSELSLIHQDLSFSNLVLEARVSRPLCANQRATPAAKNLQNVVNKFFIASVQARAVDLQRRHEQLMPAIIRLETLLVSHSTSPFRRWVKQRKTAFTESLNATKKHALIIQKIYQQCGLSAGVRPAST